MERKDSQSEWSLSVFGADNYLLARLILSVSKARIEKLAHFVLPPAYQSGIVKKKRKLEMDLKEIVEEFVEMGIDARLLCVEDDTIRIGVHGNAIVLHSFTNSGGGKFYFEDY